MKTFENFYVKKDFANALLTLERYEEEFPEALWHYNVGTVNANMGNFPLARYHLLMGKRLGLSSSELVRNKELVEDKLSIEKLERPLTATDHLVNYATNASEGTFTALSLLFLVIGLILLRKRFTIIKGVGLSLLILLPLALNFWVKSWPYAMVIESQLILEGPSSIFATKEELPAGVMVIAKGSGPWREIVWPSRFSGWIKSVGLKELE